MKTRQDNDIIIRTSPLYTEKETKLLLPIQQGMVYDED